MPNPPKCRICGTSMNPDRNPKGGRPKEYCSKKCRDMENFYLAFEKLYRYKRAQMDEHALARWTNRLMTLRNEK